MDVPKRKTLPHDVPLWVDPGKEIYFITINCRERFDYGRDSALRCQDAAARRPYPNPGNGNQLAAPEISARVFETVRHRQEKFLWWPHLFLLMPDHLHALISFPQVGAARCGVRSSQRDDPTNVRAKTIQDVVSKWKEWTAKEIGILWQRDFFERRLRHDESRRQKADYILENPVRKKFVARPEDWPFIYFADGERPPFTW